MDGRQLIKIDLTIIVPIYNEEKNIEIIFSRIFNVCNSLNLSWEIIFINDGSKDNSLHLIKKLSSGYQNVKYMSFSRNFGHQVAVSAGLDKSVGEKVVIIDADLQDPPELIAPMYLKMIEGYEVVYAKRIKRKGDGFLKKVTAKLFYKLLDRITNISIPVDTGDFRIIDKKIVEVLRQMPEPNKFLRGQISWIGYRQTFIEYEREKRNEGNTGYTYRKMLKFALDGITSFSESPLKFASITGLIVSTTAFFVIIYTLYSRLILNNYVAGWASIMISVLFLGGIQLLSIGIIGEYISRIISNVRQRPLYIVDDTNINAQN